MAFNKDTKGIAFEAYRWARLLRETAQNVQALSAEALIVDSADDAAVLSVAIEKHKAMAPYQVEQLEVAVGELLAVLAHIKDAGGQENQ